MSIITTEVKALTPEEEAAIAALSLKLATNKPRPPTDEKRLTVDQIVQIKRACVMGYSAKAISAAFRVSLAYALKMKRDFNPLKYQKVPLTLPEKAVMIQQMKADNLPDQMIGEMLGDQYQDCGDAFTSQPGPLPCGSDASIRSGFG